MSKRECRDCGNTYSLTEANWHKDKRDADGYRQICKRCAVARTAKWQRENPEKYALQRKRYRDRHIQRVRATARKASRTYRRRKKMSEKSGEW